MAANQQEIDLIVNAITKGFDKVVKDIKSVGDEQEKGEKKTKKAGNAWTELSSKINVAQEVYGKIAQIAKVTYAAISEGAQLELARSQFDNLAASIGTTSDALLTDLKQATNGMQSDAELIAGATDIINLGLADTQEGTVRLATAVSTLGLDMQQVILTFANNSKARLDALGLSVEGVTTKAAELEAQGFVGDAFDEAVLIGLEEKMTLLGDASETTAGQLQKLEAEWANVSNAGKQALAGGLAPTISGLSNTVDALNTGVASGRSGWDNFKIALGETGKALSANDAIWQNMIDTAKESDWQVAHEIELAQEAAEYQAVLAAARAEAATATDRAAEAALAHELALRTDLTTVRDINRAILEFGGNLGPTTQELEDQAYATGELEGHDEALAAAIERVKEQEEDRLAGIDATTQAEIEAAAAAKEHAATMGDYFVKAVEGDAVQDNLNQTIFDTADASGASAEQLAILGGALGLYSEEAVNAALQSALIQAKIDELTASYIAGDLTVAQMELSLQNFIATVGQIPDSVSTDVSVTGIDNAIARVGTLQSQLSSLGGQVSAADAAGATQRDSGDVGFASGTGGWVRVPGAPGQPQRITVHGGEMMNVVPNGQGGGGSTVNAPITINAPGGNPQAIQAAVTDGLLRAMRVRGL